MPKLLCIKPNPVVIMTYLRYTMMTRLPVMLSTVSKINIMRKLLL